MRSEQKYWIPFIGGVPSVLLFIVLPARDRLPKFFPFVLILVITIHFCFRLTVIDFYRLVFSPQPSQSSQPFFFWGGALPLFQILLAAFIYQSD
jgi:hypothetical protein